MRLPRKRFIIVVFLLVSAFLLWFLGIQEHLTFENIRDNRELLLSYVNQNYAFSISIFFAVYILTALFVPGTLVLTVASGFFFGFIAGTFYALLAACLGATMAFLASRYLIGSWIQYKFKYQLETINKEISRHGYNYLLVFRIVPILPFCVVNYLAGITHISKWTFIWTTVSGMLPGALVCTFAGQQLGSITSADRIFSAEIIVALVLLAVLILLPPAVRHAKRFM